MAFVYSRTPPTSPGPNQHGELSRVTLPTQPRVPPQAHGRQTHPQNLLRSIGRAMRHPSLTALRSAGWSGGVFLLMRSSASQTTAFELNGGRGLIKRGGFSILLKETSWEVKNCLWCCGLVAANACCCCCCYCCGHCRCSCHSARPKQNTPNKVLSLPSMLCVLRVRD